MEGIPQPCWKRVRPVLLCSLQNAARTGFNDSMAPRSLDGMQIDVFKRYGPFNYGGGPVYTLIYDDSK